MVPRGDDGLKELCLFQAMLEEVGEVWLLLVRDGGPFPLAEIGRYYHVIIVIIGQGG